MPTMDINNKNVENVGDLILSIDFKLVVVPQNKPHFQLCKWKPPFFPFASPPSN